MESSAKLSPSAAALADDSSETSAALGVVDPKPAAATRSSSSRSPFQYSPLPDRPTKLWPSGASANSNSPSLPGCSQVPLTTTPSTTPVRVASPGW